MIRGPRRVGRPGLIGTAARTAVIAGTASAVSGRMARRQQSSAAQQEAAYQADVNAAASSSSPQQQPQQAAEPAPGAGALDSAALANLERLGQLHQQGMLSDAEFAAAKARILGL
ncbi:SHOCT domain-containing protein [Streptacidiphilus sp. 4-A2]|nr:SHOCT domain-containing protein [Streptacidiphilus sp. 4-A2]